jgi:hypothetical protein
MERLGHRRFAAQGGDWGALVAPRHPDHAALLEPTVLQPAALVDDIRSFFRPLRG